MLLVDDERPLLSLLKKFLERQGYLVDTAESGLEATQKCRQTPCPFQLVVLDLHLPDIGGEEVMMTLTSESPDLRVLISSGTLWSTEGLPAALQTRVGFLQKPYMPKQLREAIEALTAVASR